MPALSAKQQQFCLEYLIDFNATAAALRAGYSNRSAAEIGHENLRKPQIQAQLSMLRSETGRATTVTLERTLEEIAYIAFGRMTDVLSFDNESITLKDSKDLPDSALAAIAQINQSKTPEGTTTVIKLHSKVAALALLAKYFGITNDFNGARACLKKYGLAIIEDSSSDLGWRLAAHNV